MVICSAFHHSNINSYQYKNYKIHLYKSNKISLANKSSSTAKCTCSIQLLVLDGYACMHVYIHCICDYLHIYLLSLGWFNTSDWMCYRSRDQVSPSRRYPQKSPHRKFRNVSGCIVCVGAIFQYLFVLVCLMEWKKAKLVALWLAKGKCL